MSGTLAIWYDRLNPELEIEDGSHPFLRVHVNFWRSWKRKGSTTLLDIGLQFQKPQIIQKMYLYVPIAIEKSKIQDLGKRLSTQPTLNAVFNDALEPQSAPDGLSFNALDDRDQTKIKFICQILNVDDDIELRPLCSGENQYGTLLILSEDLCNRIKNNEKQYMRLRFSLGTEGEKVFITETIPEDKYLLSSFLKTEIIEFRLNERRNYPSLVSEYTSRNEATNFIIKEVNYFLIRDSQIDYVQSHTNFKKMRRLEGDKWQAYLEGDLADSNPDRMLIYQWKKEADAQSLESIEDFSALAKFRLPWPNIGWFLAGVLFLGLVGNIYANLVTSWVKGHFISDELSANAWIGGVASILLGCWAIWIVWLGPKLQK